jgi:hypothetical protein
MRGGMGEKSDDEAVSSITFVNLIEYAALFPTWWPSTVLNGVEDG